MNNLKPIPLGIDNFSELINEGYYYVDKTDLIEYILTKGVEVNIFLRPKIFGKTLNISMLENYFSVKKKDENKNLFNGLKISKAPQKIKEQQGKYPVIRLNLRDTRYDSWDKELDNFKEIMSNLYYENIEVIEILEEVYVEYYNNIIKKTASEVDYQLSLKNLSMFLTKYYKQPTIILIDEYDAPMENASIKGFYDDAINFTDNFFGAALKTNEYLNFACMTGILRASKGSILSGFNNYVIYSIFDEQYSEYFGFVPEEVEKMLDEYNIKNREEIKEWYDGYNFGGTKIYNPWCILNAVSNRKIQTYWINTGGARLLENMLKNAAVDVKKDLEDLISGKTVISPLNENIVYPELYGSRENILNFMLMKGYLTVEEKWLQIHTITGKLKIPNIEVRVAFNNMIARWFQYNTGREGLDMLQKALLVNERETAEDALNDLILKSMSCFENVENFYHSFVLGLLVDMENEYIVESNREGGYGRYDMKIEKRDGTLGVILEFKTVKEENEDTMEEVAKQALAQIEEKNYYKDMQARGITNILKYGIAFNKKKAVLR